MLRAPFIIGYLGLLYLAPGYAADIPYDRVLQEKTSRAEVPTAGPPALHVDISGQLIGASNVTVRGALYDVTFVDGTCIDIFNGCNDASDFLHIAGKALEASQALLDQVFIDGPLGAFDTSPELTRGCGGGEFNDACLALTPNGFGDRPSVDVETVSAFNSGGEFSEYFDVAQGLIPPRAFDTATWGTFTWAVWTRALPEPSTSVLIGSSLAVLALALSRRSRARR